MNAHLQETLLSLLLAAVAAGLTVTALDIPGSAHGSIAPSTFPTVIAGLIAVLSVLNAVTAFRRMPDKGSAPQGISGKGLLNIGVFLLLSTLYVWLISVAGFVVATVAYLLLLPLLICAVSPRQRARLSQARFWVTLVVFASIATGVIYGVFVELLNVRF